VNLALWIIQGVLAALFLFAGGVKLVAPVEQLMKGIPPQLSAGFLRFVGVCEVAGALGLILPRLLKIRPGLTPLAAICLIGIMIGAVVVTLMTASAGQAAIPAIVGCLLAFVAYGRMRLAS
jgi:DoxX-like family